MWIINRLIMIMQNKYLDKFGMRNPSSSEKSRFGASNGIATITMIL